jgi:tetratricopeptide (TPR) repeat protein
MLLHNARVFSTSLAAFAACVAIACSGDPQAAKLKHIARGDGYAAADKRAEAIIEYRNAVQRDPLAGDARARLADAYARAGDGSRALAEYVRAADLLPDDTVVQLRASNLLLLAGRFADARQRTEKVLAREPRNVDAQILLANSLAGLKDLTAAVAEIEEAIQLNPDRGASYSNLGAFELQRGHKEAAERAFKRAVELGGDEASARLALANFYWVQARWDEAEKELLEVVGVAPANALAHRALANFYIATNRAADAELHLKKVLEITNDAAAAFALADYYTARRNEASARSVLETLLQRRESAALADTRLAILDYRGGQPNSAYERLARVLEKDATNLPALLTKSASLEADGRLEEALANATLAVEKHQDSTAALFALGRIQAARRQTDAAIAAFNGVLRLNPRATDAKVALARLHLAAGRPDTSVGLAQEVMAAEPQNVEARLTAVRGLLARKDLQRAQAELAVLLARAPNSAPVHAMLGVLKGVQQNQAAAREHFERALQIDRTSREAIGGLVALDLAAKRYPAALARVDEAVAQSAANPSMLMLAARAYATTGDLQRAEALLRQLLAADPAYLDAYSALAQLYVKQGRLDAALLEFEQLAKRQPRPVAALTLTGIILQGQGKNAEARDRFVRALELDPDAPVAANNLAWLYAETGEQIDMALELALRAKARLPDMAEVNDTVGWVHYKKDLASLAIPYFEKSIATDSTNALYHYHLGLAHAKAGDTTRAEAALDRALTLKPGYTEAADARRTLR